MYSEPPSSPFSPTRSSDRLCSSCFCWAALTPGVGCQPTAQRPISGLRESRTWRPSTVLFSARYFARDLLVPPDRSSHGAPVDTSQWILWSSCPLRDLLLTVEVSPMLGELEPGKLASFTAQEGMPASEFCSRLVTRMVTWLVTWLVTLQANFREIGNPFYCRDDDDAFYCRVHGQSTKVKGLVLAPH
ncbi:hypothetical protein T484DRAFT_2579448 [Baffinella frigidus]|nr:hypothetical protein T484DRAFT_2579448 [Cryptophyta sp. CCMP2293]